jgi:hypothetical protein
MTNIPKFSKGEKDGIEIVYGFMHSISKVKFITRVVWRVWHPDSWEP